VNVDSFIHEPIPTINHDESAVTKETAADINRPFKCRECPKSFKLQKTLVYHESLHKNEKLPECDFCGRLFDNEEAITAHLESHKNLKQFECNLCKFTYSNIQKFGDHFRSFHLKKV
jgi:uncharacterized Zn-finger protein